MGSPATLTVIILNFRTPDITIDCLRTLAPEAAQNPLMKVVLIDNNSGDDSVPKIRAAIEENGWSSGWLEFRPLEKNLGFAGGNNLILREQMALPQPPKYQLLLNSDTLVRPGCIATCIAIMEADPKVGAMSCMLRNRDGSVQNACRKFPTPLLASLGALGLPWLFPRLFSWSDMDDESWDRTANARDVEWIGGAYFLARTAALAQAGVMDEEFFFLGEDCEWCHRIWKNGWRIRFDPSAEIVHLGGASSDETRVRNFAKNVHTWKARFLVQRKCYGTVAETTVRSLYLASFALRIAFLWITLRGRSPKADFLRGEVEEIRASMVSTT
jgi:GT2 family glycosyltransferase